VAAGDRACHRERQRVTRGDGAAHARPTMFYLAVYPADAIVDAETGCLLRLIAYVGEAPAEWWELDDVTTEPGDTADPAGFRPHIPPGTRIVEESGNPLIDATMGRPSWSTSPGGSTRFTSSPLPWLTRAEGVMRPISGRSARLQGNWLQRRAGRQPRILRLDTGRSWWTPCASWG